MDSVEEYATLQDKRGGGTRCMIGGIIGHNIESRHPKDSNLLISYRGDFFLTWRWRTDDDRRQVLVKAHIWPCP